LASDQKHRLATLGGNGFVGSWLTRHLADQFNVAVFDLGGTGSLGRDWEVLTRYRHTQHRPTLYLDIQDACKAFEHLAAKTMNGGIAREGSTEITNLVSPHPATIVELAQIVRESDQTNPRTNQAKS